LGNRAIGTPTVARAATDDPKFKMDTKNPHYQDLLVLKSTAPAHRESLTVHSIPTVGVTSSRVTTPTQVNSKKLKRRSSESRLLEMADQDKEALRKSFHSTLGDGFKTERFATFTPEVYQTEDFLPNNPPKSSTMPVTHLETKSRLGLSKKFLSATGLNKLFSKPRAEITAPSTFKSVKATSEQLDMANTIGGEQRARKKAEQIKNETEQAKYGQDLAEFLRGTRADIPTAPSYVAPLKPNQRLLQPQNTSHGIPNQRSSFSSNSSRLNRLSNLTIITDRDEQGRLETRKKLLERRPFKVTSVPNSPSTVKVTFVDELPPQLGSNVETPVTAIGDKLKTPASTVAQNSFNKPILTYPERSKMKQQSPAATPLIYSPEEESNFKAFEQDFLKLYQAPVPHLPAPPKPPLVSLATGKVLEERHSAPTGKVSTTPAQQKALEDSLGIVPKATAIDQADFLAFIGKFPHTQAHYPNSELIPDKF
jgi:hypothetical protein